MRFGTSHDRSQSPSAYPKSASHSPAPKASRSKVANGDSHKSAQSNGFHTNGNAVADRPAVPKSFRGHDREEVTRLMIQGLQDMGYNDAAQTLIRESGCQLEGPTVASFRTAVLKGDWNEAERLLFGSSVSEYGGSAGTKRKSWTRNVRSPSPSRRRSEGLLFKEGADRKKLLFWLRRQKYLELLEKGDTTKALHVLRHELTPLNRDELHALPSLIMCNSPDELRAQAEWDGAKGRSRAQLLAELSRFISPRVMIPDNRLATLLDEVKATWLASCRWHNTLTTPSLFFDHACDPADFPRRPAVELIDHESEVWYLKYSHDGTMLASASLDTSIIVRETKEYKVLFHLEDHTSGVSHLAWSHDDSMLISCAAMNDSSARIWDMKTGMCLQTIQDFTYNCIAAAFTPDDQHVVIGSQDCSHWLTKWDLSGTLVHTWPCTSPSLRVYDLAISPNGKWLVVLLHKRILVYDLPTGELLHETEQEGDKVELTSVSISADSRYMLVSMHQNCIKLIHIETQEVLQEFTEHQQTKFIIRSGWGGADQGFVCSGSEDSRIYIYRTNDGLIEVLDGHDNGAVNCVEWHPTDPNTFASAGDDGKVVIWKPNRRSGVRD